MDTEYAIISIPVKELDDEKILDEVMAKARQFNIDHSDMLAELILFAAKRVAESSDTEQDQLPDTQ